MQQSSHINQSLLVQQLKCIFHNTHHHENARKGSALKAPSSKFWMELDVYLPSLKIGFEFQDTHHYVTTWYYQRSQSKIRSKDNIKFEAVRKKGLTLVVIPCWWDGSVDSLAATIQFHRPDLICNKNILSPPITPNPPMDFFMLMSRELPGVGELMLASFPTESQNTAALLFAHPWWMGEKYDGIRSCWQPVLRIVFSRAGKILSVPNNFCATLPHVFVDGELWFGRGLFAHTHAVIQETFNFNYWPFLRMVGFDQPARNFQKKSFELRYANLLQKISLIHPFLIVAPRVACESEEQIKIFVKSILDDGGEGVILRRQKSKYENGRNTCLIKLKAVHDDQEGIVVGVADDKSVTLKLVNGEVIIVPAADVQVPTPKIGAIATFAGERYSRRELIINPKILKLRTDISWDDVINNEREQARYLNENSAPVFTSARPSPWNAGNIRNFFEKFARSRKLDPLQPETWYSIPAKKIQQAKGGYNVGKHYGGMLRALEQNFPEIGLDSSKFASYRGLWTTIANRRKFFEQYARENGFDPHDPENWYKQPMHKIKAIRGSAGILEYYNHNFANALLDIFPDIGLEKDKFTVRYLWMDEVTRRQFFEKYARENRFDPLDPQQWYLQPLQTLESLKSITAVIAHHSRCVVRALVELFPNIGLDKHKFAYLRGDPSYARRREFFIKYAKGKGFNHLVAEDWYSVDPNDILAQKGAEAIMFYYFDLSHALKDIFRSLTIDPSKFCEESKPS